MRRFELADGTSNKFWQIEIDGSNLKITFGKIGSKGQTQVKRFGDGATATREADALIAEKTKKGYVEAGAAKTDVVAPTPKAPKPTAAPKVEREAWVFVALDGTPAFDGAFGDAYSIREGVANVRAEGTDLWGVIDREGRWVVEAQHGQTWPAFHDRLGFRPDKRWQWGYLDTKGAIVIEPMFDEIKNFLRTTPRALVRIGRKWGVIRPDGTAVVRAEMADISIGPDGWMSVRRDDGGRVGLFDAAGNQVVDYEFDAAGTFREDRSVVTRGGKRGFVDRRGEVVIPIEWDEAYDFSDGLAIVKKDGKYGYVDASGALVIPCEHENAVAFGDGRAFVWSDATTGRCIDERGKPVGDGVFATAKTFQEGTAVVGDAGKLGLVDTNGRVVLACEHDLVDGVVGGHRRIGRERRYGYVDAKGAVVCAPRWLASGPVEGDFVAVKTSTSAAKHVVVAPVAQPAAPAGTNVGAIATRAKMQPRPPLADELVAARGAAALKKIARREDAAKTLGASAYWVYEALGNDAVPALEAIAEAMRHIEYRFQNWDCNDLLKAIDSWEGDAACARIWGRVDAWARDPTRALRALAIVATSDAGTRDAAARSIATIEVEKPGAVAAALASHPKEESALREIATRLAIGVAEATGADVPECVRPSAEKKKLPDFWKPALFARPLLADGRALPLAALDEIAAKLDQNALDAASLRAACDAASLRDFAWSVFQAWLHDRAPPKQKWALLALGEFGDDAIVARLAPLVAEWPGQSAHARAVLGLEVLEKIGTDAALRAIYRLSQRAKFGGLKAEAQRAIGMIAKKRGITNEELADRLVPDFDLDDDGSTTLDFGARTFRVGFDEGLKPFVIDATGKRIDDLPKAKQTDDAAKAVAAHETWKSLKKEVRAIASLQIQRLESAMCARRRWHEDAFRMYFVEHPLLGHLARRLVWGAYEGGALAKTFRVAEDRTRADASDAAVAIPPNATIGIVHPIDLDAAAIAKWSEVLADYELLQPFEQLGRAVHAATDEERAARKLTRFAGAKVPAGSVMGFLAHGWSRGPVEDNGIVYELSHALGTMTVSPGVYFGAAAQHMEEQTLSAIDLPATWDALAFSELVRTLDAAVAKARPT